ncbi:hypothetical protein OUZ56_029819 [Daphnia magna]|uniref:Uncharacterized protein n=1 Tax=Daphnia magna TaxID=35525 RepID=A0ABR0B7Z0_9CRUS|nr:hypothetical protein OUZ56_029819 [Daphnia magna]
MVSTSQLIDRSGCSQTSLSAILMAGSRRELLGATTTDANPNAILLTAVKLSYAFALKLENG